MQGHETSGSISLVVPYIYYIHVPYLYYALNIDYLHYICIYILHIYIFEKLLLALSNMVLHLTNENATLQKNHIFLTEAYIYSKCKF